MRKSSGKTCKRRETALIKRLEDRNKIFTPRECSGIVHTPLKMAESNKAETRKDGEAVNDDITDIVGAAPALSPSPDMNPGDYMPDMAEFYLTEAEKIELLETLWSTMRMIVEMGVDVGEVDPCGQVFGSPTDSSVDAPDGVKSSFSKAMEKPSDSSDNGGAA